MKKSFLKFIMMAAVLPLAISLNSCKPEPVPTPLAEITVNGQSSATLTFEAEPVGDGARQTVSIKSNRVWAVEGVPTWLTVNPTGGNASNDAVEVEIAVNSNNEDSNARTATLSFKVSTANMATVTVRQNGQGGVIPTDGVTELYETWQTGTDYGTAAINGWTEVSVIGDRNWQTRTFEGNNYAQASAHNGPATNYEYWLISPALDITNAATKLMTFETAAGYFQTTSSLEVYVMDTNNPADTRVQITPRIVVASDLTSGTYTPWIPSGEVDLSAYSGIKHIGFRYVALGGASNSTTYQLDNFIFGDLINAPIFSVPVLAYDATSVAGNVTINVQGNVDWTAAVTEGGGFASISTGATGNGNGNITVALTENTSTTESRVARVTVSTTATVAQQSFVVTITQAPRAQGVTIGVFTSNVTLPSADSSTDSHYIQVANITYNGTVNNDVSVLKLGTGSRVGTYTTPAGLPVTGNSILSFYGFAWNNVPAVLTVTVSGGGTINGAASATFSLTANSGVAGNPPYSITTVNDGTDYFEANLAGITASSTLTFSTESPGYRGVFAGINMTAQ